MNRLDLKKELKHLYKPSARKPEVVDVPPFNFVMVDGVTYTWGANGNLLSDGVNTFTYSYANRLTGVTQGSDTYTFTYNGLGDRL